MIFNGVQHPCQNLPTKLHQPKLNHTTYDIHTFTFNQKATDLASVCIALENTQHGDVLRMMDLGKRAIIGPLLLSLLHFPQIMVGLFDRSGIRSAVELLRIPHRFEFSSSPLFNGAKQ